MRKLILLACVLTLAVGATHVHAGSISNGDFEMGFLNWSTGGSVGIETGALGSTRLDISPYAVLNTGSGLRAVEMESHLGMSFGTAVKNLYQGAAIWQNITLSAGDFVAFDWNFLTSESPSKQNLDSDFAFWTLTGVQETGVPSALDPSSTTSEFGKLAGYETTFTSAVINAGTYKLGFGVINVGNNAGVSSLLIDNVSVFSGGSETLVRGSDQLASASSVVPEPGTFAIFGLGAFGLVAGGLCRRKNATSRVV